MNKRERMLQLIDGTPQPGYTPAAFFIHFDPAFHRGQAAVQKHLEYFQYTGMDFVKIQYENVFPKIPTLQAPADWARMPSYGADFYADQWQIARGLVEAVKGEALVLMTLYSPFMCAGHTTSDTLLTEHIQENPQAVNLGMEAITDSLMTFVRGCVAAGVDGFYHSTQGGEYNRFSDPSLFNQCIKPYDLVLMEEIERTCAFNILHVCDYRMSYRDLTPFLGYPGHIVNSSLDMGDHHLTPQRVSEMFGRPFMGGLERKGTLAAGSPGKARAAAEAALAIASERFVLGADCTVPGDTSWDNLKAAIDAAHGK